MSSRVSAAVAASGACGSCAVAALERFVRGRFARLDVAATSSAYAARITSARAFSEGVMRRANERVDHAAEVLERTASLEQTNERFERLAEGRVGVERREVVARRGRLVAVALRDLSGLAEQARLTHLVALRRLRSAIGFDLADAGARVRLLRGRPDLRRVLVLSAMTLICSDDEVA